MNPNEQVKGAYLSPQNKNPNVGTGAYLTGLQYGIGPIQAHTHNNIDSSPVDSATLGGISVLYGKGIPTMKAPFGTLFVRTNADALNPTRRLYMNSNGNTTWVYFTANA